jgi:hypothetical protein
MPFLGHRRHAEPTSRRHPRRLTADSRHVPRAISQNGDARRHRVGRRRRRAHPRLSMRRRLARYHSRATLAFASEASARASLSPGSPWTRSIRAASPTCPGALHRHCVGASDDAPRSLSHRLRFRNRLGGAVRPRCFSCLIGAPTRVARLGCHRARLQEGEGPALRRALL